MSITAPPTLESIPAFPALSERAAGTYNASAYNCLNTWAGTAGPQLAALAANVYGNAQSVAAAAEAATSAAAAAVAAANYKGAWSSLTGALSIPASVTHGGNVYMLMSNTADVTSITPGASAQWQKLNTSASINRSARTSNTALAATDVGSIIDITSGTFTQTFAACATLGNGWFCYLRNSGTGDITLDPNASETLDGLTSFVMYPGEVRLIQCDGSALRSIVLSAYYRTFTSSGTFTKPTGYQRHVGWLWGAGGSGGKDATFTYGGSGGACVPIDFADAALASTEAVTIGAGGAVSTVTDGNAGGSSSFKGLTAYGGGGGGASSKGGNALLATLIMADMPAFSGASANASPAAMYGGGAGGVFVTNGRTIYGGGGGGGINSSTATAITGSTVYGGAGGAAGQAVNGTDGTAPGGGGGSTCTGTQSGAGARGELRIWGVI